MCIRDRPGAENRSFEINAYAFGQEDRPNMLINGGFDESTWTHYWSFSGSAPQLTWNADTSDFFSPPRSLRCFVAGSDYTWNWANNWSAYDAAAVPAHPARSYTVGAWHKDNVTGGIALNLFIREYYFDGARWYANGRRFASVPRRTVWAHDVMIYETGDPNVTQGLYATNRLGISCGPSTSPTPGSGENWWDDLYVKETGDWLADDRADTGAVLTVRPPVFTDFDLDGDVDLVDFAFFQACFNGPNRAAPFPECRPADLNNDGDIDLADFATLQSCFNGPNRPPACEA